MLTEEDVRRDGVLVETLERREEGYEAVVEVYALGGRIATLLRMVRESEHGRDTVDALCLSPVPEEKSPAEELFGRTFCEAHGDARGARIKVWGLLCGRSFAAPSLDAAARAALIALDEAERKREADGG